MNTSDSNTHAVATSNRSRNLLVAAAVVIALIVGVYFWGSFQTRSQLSAQKADYEQRIVSVQDQLQTARADMSIANNRNLLLLARTDIYRAAADLDARNFGTANARLQEAGAALGKVNASSGDFDAEKLAALRASIAGTNINVATNLQEQRTQVLGLAAQLDAMALAATPTAAAR